MSYFNFTNILEYKICNDEYKTNHISDKHIFLISDSCGLTENWDSNYN